MNPRQYAKVLYRRALVRGARVLGQSHIDGRLAPHVAVSTFDVPIADLPAGLEGFTIVQVSDIHVGQGVWRPIRLNEVTQHVKTATPDVVVNTGDYLQGMPSLSDVVEVARTLRMPGGPTRNIAILGNHDYFAGPEAVAELTHRLGEAGITVLANMSTCVEVDVAGCWFVGICGDAECGDIQDGIRALGEAGHPRIALLHEPDLIHRLPEGAADLVLAGHTHGGQIVLPPLRGRIVQRFCGSRFVQGWYTVRGMRMYVNRGIGCTGLPFRLNADPEVSVFRLSR